MINLIAGALPGLLKIGDKLIEDKDKRAEFAHKAMEIMLQTNTYKWVDALVKLSYASEQIVKGLFRPLGAAAAFIFVAYCQIKGIELSPVVETVGVSLAPAWGVSRYKEKTQKKPEPEDWGD